MHKHWDHHVIGPVSTNCYVFGNPENAGLIDPGGPEAPGIAKKLMEQGVEIKHVLVTHGHFDHLSWATEVQKAVEGARVYLHEAEKPVYEEFHDWMSRYGMQQPELREPDVWVKEGDKISAGGYEFDVLHTPGHSPGSATFVTKNFKWDMLAEEAAFVGDCLFKNSIGRIDLPYCNADDMERSLRKLMDELDPHSHLFPGHMELTNMDTELHNNPYLLGLKNNQRHF